MSSYQDVYRLVENYSVVGGSLVQCVYHFRHEGVAGVADANLLAGVGSYMGALFSYRAVHVDDGAQLVDADLTRVNNLGEILADLGSVAIGVNGSNAGQGGAPTLALLTRMTTANPNVEGSKYLPGYVNAAITEGVFTTAVTAAAATWLFNLLAGFTVDAVSFKFGVISTKLATFVPFGTTGVVTNKPAHQRRRGFGVGQ